MKLGKKKIIVVGDRVLVKPVNYETRTKMGLYLPDTVKEKDDVITGLILDKGPGIPMSDLSSLGNEPWKDSGNSGQYVPMQAENGDYALFLKKAAIEIKIDNDNYYVVPQAAILVLLRNDENPLDSISEEDLTI